MKYEYRVMFSKPPGTPVIPSDIQYPKSLRTARIERTTLGNFPNVKAWIERRKVGRWQKCS